MKDGNMTTTTDRIVLDRMIDITVAAGVISCEGHTEINAFLRKLGIPELPDWWDWHTRVGGKGEYVGSFPKRVAKYYYQTIHYKMESDNLGIIGSIMSRHTNRDNQYSFDFTDYFDWEAGDFGDDGSCFWSCRKGAREALEDHGAYAVRFYDENGGYARAWICRENDYCVIFNGCGLLTADIARIIADHWGVSYRKINLDNRGDSSGLIWINSGIGYAVGAESTVNGLSHVSLDIDSGPVCCGCNCSLDDECNYVEGTGDFCEECFHNDYFHCSVCGDTEHNDNCHEVVGQYGTDYVCWDCRSRNYTECDDCHDYHPDNEVRDIDDRDICDSCFETEKYHTCNNCDNTHDASAFSEVDDEYICDGCIEQYICSECGKESSDMDSVHGKLVCSDCIEEAEKSEYPLLVG